MTRIVPILALAVCVGIGWLVLRFRQDNRAVRRELVQLQEWIRSTQERERQAEEGLHLARQTLAATPPVAHPPAEAPSIVAGAPPPSTKPRPHSLEVLQKDPEVLAYALAVRRAELRAHYGRLYRMLNLTDQQVTAFADNVMAKEGSLADLHATRLESGLRENDPAVRKLASDIDAEYQRAQERLLGPAGKARLDEYEPSLNVRKIIAGFVGAAVVAGVPWTMQQAEDVVQAAIQLGPRGNSGYVNLGRVDWDRLDEQARQILTPEQFDVFTTTQPHEGGAGARFLSRLNHLIDEAVAADNAAAAQSAR